MKNQKTNQSRICLVLLWNPKTPLKKGRRRLVAKCPLRDFQPRKKEPLACGAVQQVSIPYTVKACARVEACVNAEPCVQTRKQGRDFDPGCRRGHLLTLMPLLDLAATLKLVAKMRVMATFKLTAKLKLILRWRLRLVRRQTMTTKGKKNRENWNQFWIFSPIFIVYFSHQF